MTDSWTVVRYLHVLGAIVWVGGQLTVNAILLPAARTRLVPSERTALFTAVSHRFALLTVAGFLPLQVATGCRNAAGTRSALTRTSARSTR
ncbi:MAG: hypothetical protein GEV04_13650 [Actinophytocola sp.]|nr:hypothetical protein [Actinophytocola sp.]